MYSRAYTVSFYDMIHHICSLIRNPVKILPFKEDIQGFSTFRVSLYQQNNLGELVLECI